MNLRALLLSCALSLAACEALTVVPSPTLQPSAGPSSAHPSPTRAPGRVVTILRGDGEDAVAPVNGAVTVCDFRIRGTIFDYRSGITYHIDPARNDRQAYDGHASTDESGTWLSPVISLSDGDWTLTVQGALTHPDQSHALRVACPGGRPPTPSPTVTLGPVSAAGTPTTLELFPQGRLSGKVAWVTKTVPGAASPGGRPGSTLLELWAVPLDRTAPRLAARYRSTQMNSFGNRADTNVLRRQFSPDGRRIVLSIATGSDADGHGLAIVDLETGRLLTMIGGRGERELSPAWSPDGRLIAFVRPLSTTLASEIWVVGADGSGARRLRPATLGTPNRVFGWTRDSTRIGFSPVDFESTTYALLDLNGRMTGELRGILNSGDAVDWRGTDPGFAVSVTDSPYTPTRTRILVASDPAVAPRVVAEVVVDPSGTGAAAARDPRWDPSGSDRIIYVEAGSHNPFVLADISTANVTARHVSSRVRFAEWLPDGSGIVTLEEHPSTAPLSAWLYDTDAKVVTSELFLPNPKNEGYELIDLAPQSY